MANYFSQYQGGGPAALPPGYMQAATAPGRYLAEGFESLGNSISEGLEKYRKNKEKREILTEKGEFVAQQKMQDLASWVNEDPQRADTPEYEQKLKDVQKFSEGIAEMPLGKLEAAISNYSLEKEIEGRRFAQDMEARRLGIAEDTRADVVEDRKTRREREAAYLKAEELLSQVPTTKTEESPGYYGYVETPQQPVTPAAVEPNPNQSIIDEVRTNFEKLPPAEAIKKAVDVNAETQELYKNRLKDLGVTIGKDGSLSFDKQGKTPSQETIEEARYMSDALNAAIAKGEVLSTLGEEDLAPTLPPVRIQMPEVEPEYKWFPPTTETRKLTPQERYSQIQKITAEYGPQMGAELLGKWRNITTQYDPNAPSPIRETEGPSGQQYYYNVESKASGLVPNKDAVGATVQAALLRGQAADKKYNRGKQDRLEKELREALREVDELEADVAPDEGKIKAAKKNVERIRAKLDEATDLGTFDPLTDQFIP